VSETYLLTYLLTEPDYINRRYSEIDILRALLTRRTVLHDLPVLAIRRIMQINCRPTEII